MEYFIPHQDIFIILMDEKKVECFSNTLKAIKNIGFANTCMISEVLGDTDLCSDSCQPRNSCSGERPFSAAR